MTTARRRNAAPAAGAPVAVASGVTSRLWCGLRGRRSWPAYGRCATFQLTSDTQTAALLRMGGIFLRLVVGTGVM